MKFVKELIPYIIIVVVVILIRSFIVTPVRVTGNSMEKTLQDGDIMILNKLASFDREDIVVISKGYAGDDVIIKRVIGMPGEKIKCEDSIIYIDDKEYKDSHAYGKTSDFEEITLKDDEYFVLGDNRVVSNDSRYLGPVKEELIEGTTNIIIYPFSKIGKTD